MARRRTTRSAPSERSNELRRRSRGAAPAARSRSLTTVVLVRHGHVEGIEPERFRGRADLALTPRGQLEAQATRDAIASRWQPAALYSSPLQRCMHTGELIANACALSVEPLPGLSDINYGDWQGLTPTQVEQRWPEALALWYAAPHLAEIPGGESLQDVAARATRALRNILRQHKTHTVVVVAHDSLNRVLLLHALDLPLSHYRSITQAPCALNVVDFDGERFFVRTLNETGHLRAI